MSSILIRRANVVYSGGFPSGYTELAYIQSSGTQYIDTGFKPNNNTCIEITATMLSATGTRYFGSYQNLSSGPYFGCGFSNSGYFVNQYNTQNTVTSRRSDTSHHVVKKDKQNLYIDGTLVNTNTSATFQIDYNIVLLAANVAGDVQFKSSAMLYSCKLYDNGNLIRDLIPAKRNADNVVGMYDLVSDTFLTNAGSGSFSYGEL